VPGTEFLRHSQGNAKGGVYLLRFGRREGAGIISQQGFVVTRSRSSRSMSRRRVRSWEKTCCLTKSPWPAPRPLLVRSNLPDDWWPISGFDDIESFT
jgi:hypothetical protein